MRALFLSGYIDETIARRGVLELGVKYPGEPFAPERLASKIKDVLDKPRV